MPQICQLKTKKNQKNQMACWRKLSLRQTLMKALSFRRHKSWLALYPIQCDYLNFILLNKPIASSSTEYHGFEKSGFCSSKRGFIATCPIDKKQVTYSQTARVSKPSWFKTLNK